jgi:phosphohistidine phosphatase SixA
MNAIDKGPLMVFPFVVAAAWLASLAAQAQTLSGDELVEALQGGGYVLVMRHASSPRERPSAEAAAPGNIGRERQLDDEGRALMSAMSYAFRELDIPVGDTLSSPAFRTVETARYFGFGDLQTVPELGGGERMASRGGTDSSWLERKVAEPPPDGSNTVIITHGPNISDAFGDRADDVAEGETLIFRPGRHGADLVARLPVREWAVLAVD